jgi:hypothetical protein
LISREDAFLALHQFLALDIKWLDPPVLPVRAAELAEIFSRGLGILRPLSLASCTYEI